MRLVFLIKVEGFDPVNIILIAFVKLAASIDHAATLISFDANSILFTLFLSTFNVTILLYIFFFQRLLTFCKVSLARLLVFITFILFTSYFTLFSLSALSLCLPNLVGCKTDASTPVFQTIEAAHFV